MAYILLVAEKEDEESKKAEDVLEEHHGYDVHLIGRDVELKDAFDGDYVAAILLSTATKFAKEKKLKSLLARMHGEGKPVGAVGEASKIFPVTGLIMVPDSSTIIKLCETVVDALEASAAAEGFEERHKEGLGRHAQKAGKSISVKHRFKASKHKRFARSRSR